MNRPSEDDYVASKEQWCGRIVASSVRHIPDFRPHVVDSDVDVQNEAEVAWIAGTHVDPARDIEITRGPVDDLDDAALFPAFGGKMGIDATRKWRSEGFDREWPDAIVMDEKTKTYIDSIWQKLGL